MSGRVRMTDAAAALLHPVALASIATLVVNDHLLKHLWPGVVTGKLSDLAGLGFFPLLLWTFASGTGTTVEHSRRLLAVLVFATGVGFAAIQLVEQAVTLYGQVWGWLQWPLQEGFPRYPPGSVTYTSDVTDLACLPMLMLSWNLGVRHLEHIASRNPSPGED